MSAKILLVTYGCSLSQREFDETIARGAGDLAKFPGLQWKIWIVDEGRKTCGGVHLFDDGASVEAYLRQVIDGLADHPAVTGVTTNVFDIMTAPSLVTRGPIADAVRI